MDHDDNKDHWCQLPKESLHQQAPSPPQCYQKLYLFQRFVDRKLVRFGIFVYKSWEQPWSPGYDVLNDQLELLMSNHFGISSSFVLRMKFCFHYVKSIFSFFINLNVVRSCTFLRWAFSRGCRIEKLFSLPISFHLLEETNLTFNSRKKSFFWKKKKIKGKELSSKIVLWHVSAIKRKQWLDFYF